jgi:hypothetical protein
MLNALLRAPSIRTCQRCASTLVLGEYTASGVSSSTRASVTAAGKLGGPVHVLLAGVGAKAAAAGASQITGVSKVLYSEEPSVSHGMAEGLSALLQSLQASNSAWGHGAVCGGGSPLLSFFPPPAPPHLLPTPPPSPPPPSQSTLT